LKRWIAAATAGAVLATAAFAVSSAGRRTADERRPNILLIVVDTLRRDRVGIYASRHATTPTIDDLAAANVIFANAYANSNWTKPSIASLFTGLYVGQHGVKYVVTDQSGELPMTQRLPEDATTIAEILKADGYSTLGVVENIHVSAKLGFSQGFDLWDESAYGAMNVTNRFIEHLDEAKGPLFAYVHYFDPHAPYYRTRFFETEGDITPGLQEAKSNDYRWTTYTFGVDCGIIGLSPIERQRLEALYDGEVRNADVGIARILATLKQKGLFENTWIIITADHGENFYEGRRVTHPHDCFSNPQMRIPLVMKMPAATGDGNVVVTDAVQLVDIAPTIMALLGLQPLPGMVGANVLPAVLDGKSLGARQIAAESESGVMLVESKYKYVSVPTKAGTFVFLYDESADPLEEHDLAAGDPALAARLDGLYKGAAEAAMKRETVKAAGNVRLSEEEVERMRSLGYLLH